MKSVKSLVLLLLGICVIAVLAGCPNPTYGMPSGSRITSANKMPSSKSSPIPLYNLQGYSIIANKPTNSGYDRGPFTYYFKAMEDGELYLYMKGDGETWVVGDRAFSVYPVEPIMQKVIPVKKGQEIVVEYEFPDFFRSSGEFFTCYLCLATDSSSRAAARAAVFEN